MLCKQDSWLSVKQFAGLIGTSPRTVYPMLRAGKLPPPIRLSPRGRMRWRRSDVEAWLRSRDGNPPPADPLGDLLRRAADLSDNPAVKKVLLALADSGEGD
jgi:excisionase family DNA binding protein